MRIRLDEQGRRTAVLRDDGPAPTSRTTITTPRPVTAFDRARVADAAAGPGTRTTSMAAIAGRWTVAGLNPEHALLTLEPAGGWTIRGGCESGTGQDLGGSGTFRLLPHGFLLTVEGGVAGVGCSPPARTPPADTAALTDFVEARSLRAEHDHLTLFDQRGRRIGRLTRVSDSVPPSSGATAASPAASSAGCTRTATRTPSDAKTATVVDLDGAGRRDTEWAVLQPGGTLRFGITTASGATIEQRQGFAGGGDRSFVACRLADGVVVGITSDGRESPVWTFSHCAFHPSPVRTPSIRARRTRPSSSTRRQAEARAAATTGGSHSSST